MSTVAFASEPKSHLQADYFQLHLTYINICACPLNRRHPSLVKYPLMGEQQSQGHWLGLPQFSEMWNAREDEPKDNPRHTHKHTHTPISNEWDELLPRVLQKEAY